MFTFTVRTPFTVVTARVRWELHCGGHCDRTLAVGISSTTSLGGACCGGRDSTTGRRGCGGSHFVRADTWVLGVSGSGACSVLADQEEATVVE